MVFKIIVSKVKKIDHGWDRIESQLKLLKDAYIKVGVLSNAGSYEKSGKANLADVATWNEYGTSRIPPRPFMRQTAAENREKVKDSFKKAVLNIELKKKSASGELNYIGVLYKGEIQKTIAQGNFQANAESTIRIKSVKRKKITPLIDTGRLRQSISYETVMKK